MKIKAFLIISDRESIRVTKNIPGLSNNEIAIAINLDIPDVFFKRLIPSVSIQLPEEAILQPDERVAVSVAAFEVSDKLKLDFKDVQDGLQKLVDEKKSSPLEEKEV